MPSFFQDPTLSMSPYEIERARAAQALRIANAAAAAEAAESEAGSSSGSASHSHHHGGGGPRTPEGKARSAQNAIKHGFGAANPVILCIEDQESWDAQLASYVDTFQPLNQPEADVVRRAALAMWNLDRLTRIETTLFGLEFGYHTVMTDARLMSQNCGPIERMAVAFKESAGDGAFDLCRRYLQAASREHDHALRTFYFLESKRSRHATASAPNPQVSENTRKPNELPQNRPPVARNRQIVPIDTNNKPEITPFSPSNPVKSTQKR